MTIKTLFDSSKDIYRTIEKVITYGAAQEERLKAEITEYVVTDNMEEQFEELLTKMQLAMEQGGQNEVGVWVSGFYGSGKSSFTKYLGLALDEGVTVDGVRFLRHLQDRLARPQSKALLNTIAGRYPVAVIMLDLASEMLAGAAAPAQAADEGQDRDLDRDTAPELVGETCAQLAVDDTAVQFAPTSPTISENTTQTTMPDLAGPVPRELAEIWRRVRANVKLVLQPGSFQAWIEPCALIGLEENDGRLQAHLEVPSPDKREWLVHRMGNVLPRAFREELDREVEVLYCLPGEAPAAAAPPAPSLPGDPAAASRAAPCAQPHDLPGGAPSPDAAHPSPAPAPPPPARPADVAPLPGAASQPRASRPSKAARPSAAPPSPGASRPPNRSPPPRASPSPGRPRPQGSPSRQRSPPKPRPARRR